jgi:putative transposase
MGGIVKGLGGVPLAIGGMPEHVHLLTGLTSSHRIDYVLRDIKADSTIFVKAEFEPKFSWQKGYGAFTVSPSGIEAVRRYILTQEEHHAKKTFRDEYVELLDKTSTPYDEKFLW